jgi:hypothetical protein
MSKLNNILSWIGIIGFAIGGIIMLVSFCPFIGIGRELSINLGLGGLFLTTSSAGLFAWVRGD